MLQDTLVFSAESVKLLAEDKMTIPPPKNTVHKKQKVKQYLKAK